MPQCGRDSRLAKYEFPPGNTSAALFSPTALLYTLDSRAWAAAAAAEASAAAPSGGEQQMPGVVTEEDAAKAPAAGGAGQLDAAVRELLHPLARQVMLTWTDAFRQRSRPVPEGPERRQVVERDTAVREQGIQADLTANLPRLFGQEITDQILEAFQNP